METPLMDDETWTPLPGADWYEVSDRGRLVSLRRANYRRHLRPHAGPCGLNVANLMLPDGDRIKQTNVRVGNLVALAFLGERPRHLRVRHLNGDTLDDRLENLAYGTPEEVMADHAARARREEAAGAPTHCAEGHPYADSYFGNYGQRFCAPCRWAERASFKDTEPLNTHCLDCGTDLLPVFPHRRTRCADCARRQRNRQSSAYKARKVAERQAARVREVHHCQDCGTVLPPKRLVGPVAKRCEPCRRTEANAASRRYAARRGRGEKYQGSCSECGAAVEGRRKRCDPCNVEVRRVRDRARA